MENQTVPKLTENPINDTNPEPVKTRPRHGVKRVKNYAEIGFNSNDDDSDYTSETGKNTSLDNKCYPSKSRLQTHNNMTYNKTNKKYEGVTVSDDATKATTSNTNKADTRTSEENTHENNHENKPETEPIKQ